MKRFLIKRKETGRGWGDKRPEQISKGTIGGLALRVIENDAWEGPCEVGEQGHYDRLWWVEAA